LGASWSETPGFVFAENLAAWQSSPDAALLILLISGLWMGFPLIMLAATAGLKMIPIEVYEAAEIDGATSWQKFSGITWPLLLPLLTPALIIRGIMTFNQFYLFYVFNPPFPALSLASISYFFFDFGNYATSAVINLITVLILLLFLIWFNRVSHAGEGVTYA
jgi:arabinogalactan oligomer/maltooligosaccharide transport system permease protein